MSMVELPIANVANGGAEVDVSYLVEQLGVVLPKFKCQACAIEVVLACLY